MSDAYGMLLCVDYMLSACLLYCIRFFGHKTTILSSTASSRWSSASLLKYFAYTYRTLDFLCWYWNFFLQLFEKVEVDKPAASRSASAEIYLLGLKYKAPAKIDPRLLDVKHLFEGSIEPQRKVNQIGTNIKMTFLQLHFYFANFWYFYCIWSFSSLNESLI